MITINKSILNINLAHVEQRIEQMRDAYFEQVMDYVLVRHSDLLPNDYELEILNRLISSVITAGFYGISINFDKYIPKIYRSWIEACPELFRQTANLIS